MATNAPVIDRIRGMSSRIHQPLYDTYLFPAGAAPARVPFFMVPFGTAGSGIATAKTWTDTNMQSAGQLPAGYNFRCKGVVLSAAPDITLADAILLTKGALLTIWVGESPRFRIPAVRLSQGGGLYTPTAAALHVGLGHPGSGNFYKLDEPIDIEQQSTFHVDLDYDAAITMGAATRVQVHLEGFLWTPVR